MNNHKKLYKDLNDLLAILLTIEFTPVKKEDMIDIFFENWINIMPSLSDVSMTPAKFRQLKEFLKKKPTKEELCVFMGKLSDDAVSYAMANYFLARFIEGYLSVVKDEYKTDVLNLLQQFDLAPKRLKAIQENNLREVENHINNIKKGIFN
ncbi:MAG: hypothetical protein KatS3mg090_0964 [Patescibacteria group bacterium]|nr:MAG: hypothetical protein KatS3mg090_0964 [Patescibacteria group bacterium]